MGGYGHLVSLAYALDALDPDTETGGLEAESVSTYDPYKPYDGVNEVNDSVNSGK